MLGFPQTGGIIDQLRKDDRTGRRQRPPSPPEMERTGMPVADGFLPGTSDVDGIERQCNLDELFWGDDGVVGHGLGLFPVFWPS